MTSEKKHSLTVVIEKSSIDGVFHDVSVEDVIDYRVAINEIKKIFELSLIKAKTKSIYKLNKWKTLNGLTKTVTKLSLAFESNDIVVILTHSDCFIEYLITDFMAEEILSTCKDTLTSYITYWSAKRRISFPNEIITPKILGDIYNNKKIDVTLAILLARTHPYPTDIYMEGINRLQYFTYLINKHNEQNI